MRKDKLYQTIGFWASRIAIMIALGFLGLIIFYITEQGIGIISWNFLTRSPEIPGGGIFPQLVGTLLLVGLVIVFTVPIGVMTAIYLSEYASQESRLTSWVTQAVYNLRGVPSIVIGLFAMAFFVNTLFGEGLLSGALALSLIALPTVIVTSLEALRSVPDSFRKASAALGASRGETVRKAVIRPAFPGIITGGILGVGEAAGETAPLLFAGAYFHMAGIPSSLLGPFSALPYHLYELMASATNIQEARPFAFGEAFVLLGVVLSFYLAATIIRNYYREKREW